MDDSEIVQYKENALKTAALFDTEKINGEWEMLVQILTDLYD